jgi:hypothetical protein
MLIAQLVEQIPAGDLPKDASLAQAEQIVLAHPQVCREILELLDVLAMRISHVTRPLSTHPAVPLRVHGRYTRYEILAAFGDGEAARTPVWREGVKWMPSMEVDLFTITHNKTEGVFSPSTSYKDYAISPTRFHWESQSTTTAGSPTGRRYQTHVENGSAVILFARLNQSDRSFLCLGPARYVSHVGEKPMAIVWDLEVPIPGDVFPDLAAAVS